MTRHLADSTPNTHFFQMQNNLLVCVKTLWRTIPGNFEHWCSPPDEIKLFSTAILFPEFVSRNNHLQKCKHFDKLSAFNSRWREMRHRCICKTINALCVIVLETFRFRVLCLAKTEGVASTLSRISSTFCGVSAVFSHLGTLFHTEYYVQNLFMILKIVDLFSGVTSVNSTWNSCCTLA